MDRIQNNVKLEVKILDPRGQIPTRNRKTDVGYDLYAIEDTRINYHNVVSIRTGIAIAAPPGYYYTLEGRSGLNKQGLMVFHGIIDSTYTGEIIVMIFGALFNAQVQSGDRIAQLILHRQIDIEFALVDEFSPIYNQRGAAGWSSSGR